MVPLEITYREAFERAEKHLKDAERFVGAFASDDMPPSDSVGGVFVPAVNELRYAGSHAAQALRDGADSKAEYEDAIRHCKRACFDALDAQVQYALEECRQFSVDYSRVVVSTVIKEYTEEKVWLNKFKAKLRAKAPKEEQWEFLESNISILLEIYARWDCGREELNKMLQDVNSKRWRETVYLVFGAIGTIAAVVTVVNALLR